MEHPCCLEPIRDLFSSTEHLMAQNTQQHNSSPRANESGANMVFDRVTDVTDACRQSINGVKRCKSISCETH